MCGIAGWLDFEENLKTKENIIEKMSNTLKRRGPDASGVFLKKNVCLIHRRLIVVDPENGQQPMGPLVYNGELYNTEDLRKELFLLGHSFTGHSDTEVLLKSFQQWGKDCVNKFNGIFAFAIWDKKNKELFIARDRIGVKPIFFYLYKNGIIFGSEIKTLLANPIVKPKLDENSLNEIFFIGPGRTSGYGIIKNIQELKPGECATFSQKGLNRKIYWKIKAKEFNDNIEQSIEKTKFLLTDSIERQLVSDMPLCCFLSGGLDSSIISKTASEYYKRHNLGKINTYSVDYTDNEKYFQKSVFQPNSDDKYINMMINDINSNHKKIILNNKDLFNALIPALCARDLPGMADIDSSLLLFCKEVKKDFTVALSGECADEIFGGYPWYHNQDVLNSNTFPWSQSLEIRKSILNPNLSKHSDEYVYCKYIETIKNTDKLDTDSKSEARMREMFMLNINWFMQTLLDRKDRMSMYNGLEVRVPFCDYRIVEYAYNMPWSIKALNGREKGIVREAMKNILPDEIISRKKSPYPKTHNPIYMNLVSSKVKEILKDKNSILKDFLDYNGVMKIIEEPDKISSPWYGQLMRAPQILAYIIQLDTWFKEYKITN